MSLNDEGIGGDAVSYPLVKIAEFCKTGSGGTPSRTNLEFYDGDIPWIKSGELRETLITTASEFITELAVKNSSAKIVPKGAILLAMYGATVGRMAILEIDAATNQAVCNIVPDEKTAFPKYVYYALLNKVPYFLKNAIGGAQPNISQGMIKDTEITLPPLPEQKRIAAILDKADAIRRKRQQAIQLADDFLRAVFLDMFGDPVMNPKGWRLEELGSMATIRRGASPRPIANYLGGSIPWIKIGDGSKGNQIYLEKTAAFVTEDGAAKSVYLDPGSLIFANCGVSLGFARILKFGGCIHDGWLSIENLEPCVNKVFLLKWINQLTNYFRSIAPDGTQPNLNTGIMKTQKLMMPPIELQNRFECIVHSNERLLNKITNSQIGNEELFSSLSKKAFSGQL